LKFQEAQDEELKPLPLRSYRLWAALAPLWMMLEVAGDLMQPRLTQAIVDQCRHRTSAVVLHFAQV
jgi:hypothetical protein